MSEGQRPVSAVLFDLGGVVIDLDFGRAFQIWALRAGCNPGLIAERFSIDEFYEQHERGEITGASYFASLRQSLGIWITDEEFAEGWNDIYVGPRPGMSELLARVQRHRPLFAFTNSNPTHQAVWQTRYADELLPFRRVFVSSELGVRKPDPEAFLLVARHMGYEPEETLFFDDGFGNVEGARAAGMQAVLVTSTGDVRQALSPWI